MKKISNLFIPMLSVCLMATSAGAFAQTSSGTVNPGTANDPMVVDPGRANDSIAVKPGKTNDDMATLTDTGFINKNIVDNMMEVQLSKLAVDKSTSADVKKVARLMV